MILLARHGQTQFNFDGKVMGKCDVPLNDHGKEQAQATANNLSKTDPDIDLIICSPLQRAKQTAEIINAQRNIPMIYDQRIAERDFGEFDGMKKTDFDFYGFWDYYKNTEYKNAEDIKEFFKRIYAFLDETISKYRDKKVLIVTHGGIAIATACYFNGNIPTGSLIHPDLILKNCGVARYLTN